MPGRDGHVLLADERNRIRGHTAAGLEHTALGGLRKRGLDTLEEIEISQAEQLELAGKRGLDRLCFMASPPSRLGFAGSAAWITLGRPQEVVLRAA